MRSGAVQAHSSGGRRRLHAGRDTARQGRSAKAGSAVVAFRHGARVKMVAATQHLRHLRYGRQLAQLAGRVDVPRHRIEATARPDWGAVALFVAWAWFPTWTIVVLRQGGAFGDSRSQMLTSVPLSLWPLVLVRMSPRFRRGVANLLLRSGMLWQFMLPYIVVAALGGFVSGDVFLAIGRPVSECAALLVAAGFVSLIGGSRTAREALTGYALIGAACVVYYAVTTPHELVTRIGGALNPNSAGLLVIGVALAGMAVGRFWVWGGAVLPSMYVCWLTASRSSLLAIIVGFAALWTVRGGRQLWAAVALILVGTLIALSVPIAPLATGFLEDRLALHDPTRGVGSGFSGRTSDYEAGLTVWRGSPLIGVGSHGRTYHNAYIELLAMHGILGALLFGNLLTRAALGLLRRRQTMLRTLGLAVILGYLARLGFEGSFIRPANAMGALFEVAVVYGWLQGAGWRGPGRQGNVTD